MEEKQLFFLHQDGITEKLSIPLKHWYFIYFILCVILQCTARYVLPVEFRTRNCAEKSVSRNRKPPPNFSFPPSCDEGAGSNDQTWTTTATTKVTTDTFASEGGKTLSPPPRLAQRGKGKEEGALDLRPFYGLAAAARLGGKWQKCCANIFLDCCLFLSCTTFSFPYFSGPRATFAFPILCFFCSELTVVVKTWEKRSSQNRLSSRPIYTTGLFALSLFHYFVFLGRSLSLDFQGSPEKGKETVFLPHVFPFRLSLSRKKCKLCDFSKEHNSITAS